MKYYEIADKTKINWVETDIFAGLSYLDDIIKPEQWNDFVEYVDRSCCGQHICVLYDFDA